MKKQVKVVRQKLIDISKELDLLLESPAVSRIKVGLDETFSSVVKSFNMKADYMVKQLNTVIAKLPAEPKEKIKRVKKKQKTSQRLAQMIHILNPKEATFVWGSGGKEYNSRQECAKILLEIRALERREKHEKKN